MSRQSTESPWCQDPECGFVLRDRDRWRQMAMALHRAAESEIGVWEARAYLVRDESIRDQLIQAKDQVDTLLTRLHYAEAVCQAVGVDRNARSEHASWNAYVKENDAT